MFNFLKRQPKNLIVTAPTAAYGDVRFVPVTLSPDMAKRCGAVYSCVRVLADGIAQLPCQLLRRDGDMTEKVTADPLAQVLNVEPVPAVSSFPFWRWQISNMLIAGFMLAFKIRNSAGQIIRLVPVHPHRLSQISQANDGTLLFHITRRNGEQKWFPQEEIFFVPYALDDDVTKPVGPLHYADVPVQLANAAEQYMFGHVVNDGKPNGYWKKDGTLRDDNAFKRLKAQLQDALTGKNQGSTPLVEEGIEFKAVSLSAVDMQMIEQRRYTVEDICGRFGVPPHKIGDTTQAKGWSTLEQQQSEFVAESLAPVCIRIEKEINRQLVPRADWGKAFAKFNFNALLRGDTSTRAAFYQTMFQIGALSINEIRAKEDLNPIPDGDKHFVPLNFDKLEDGENNA
jgi:HK97 family phage portal protein